MAFFNEVQTYLKERANSDDMNVYLKPLGQSLAHLQEASMWFMQNAIAKPDNAGAGSYDYMHLFGLVALGYMWCRITEAVLAKKGNASAQRMTAKLVTARFFMERMLPRDHDTARAHSGGRRFDHGIAGRRVLDLRSYSALLSGTLAGPCFRACSKAMAHFSV